MLDKVRKPGKAKSVYRFVGYISLGVICLSFVFIGLTPDTGSFSGGGAAAIVNDTAIPIRSFREAVERETRQIGSGFNNLPAAQRRSFERRIRERTINSLVSREVLFQSASEHGFHTPDVAVRDEVVGLPAFQEDGRFSRQRYLALLEANRLSVSDFEADMRKQVTIDGVRDGFTHGLRKPTQMELMEKKAQSVELDISFIAVQQNELDVSALTAPKALKEYVANQSEKIKKYFESNPAEFDKEKEVKARHILVKTSADKPAEKALKEIQAIREGLTVENFSEVAKNKSEDAGSKTKGGDLGFFGKGRMVPEFEKVAMSIEPGVISDPVKSNFGYHLILVDEVRGGGQKGLKSVEKDIARKLIEKDGRKEAMAEIEEAVKSGKNLEAVLKKYKLTWADTGKFKLNQSRPPKIGGAEEVVTEALGLKVGETSQRLVRSEGKAHIVKLKSLTLPESVDSVDLAPSFSSAAMESLNRWAEALQDEARVQTNDRLMDL